mgnify:CR=1 FL=1
MTQKIKANRKIIPLTPILPGRNECRQEINKLEYLAIKQDLDKDYQTGARIVKVCASSLPSGVLGMYVPSQHTIYLREDLEGNDGEYVKAHEQGHATGIMEEEKADSYALARTGTHLRPFGQSRCALKY